MPKTKKVYCTIFACLILVAPVMAQQGKNTLTNADVVKMVKAGLPENTVIMAIQQSHTNFDTSPDALVALKDQGISAPILDAMLQAQGNRLSPPSTGATSAPTLRTAAAPTRGLKLIDGANQVEMKYTTADMRSSGMFGNPFSVKVRWALNGNHAQLRITNTSPTFEVSIPNNVQPADYVTLAKLDTKSDRRELQAVKAGLTGSSNQLPKDKLVPITLEESQGQSNSASGYYKLYMVKLVNPIPPGEYAVLVQGSFYDFGVDASK